MTDQQVLYKILNEIGEVKTNIAVIVEKQSQFFQNQIDLVKEQEKIKTNHYKLDKDFNKHKNKFLLITSAVSAFFGAITTYIWNKFIGQ